MKRANLILVLGLTGALASSASAAKQLASNQCLPEAKAVIGAEERCFENGLDIGFNEEAGAKVACMEDKRVQGACGADGHVTRLHAYNAWYSKLKQFEANCLTNGGRFAYADPAFEEPSDDSYCLQAQPEVGYNMFESSLCNYRSICPSVTVVCEYNCDKHDLALREDAELMSAQANLGNYRR